MLFPFFIELRLVGDYFEIFLCLDIGITFSPSSINKSILQLLRYGFFEFFEYVIVVKQYVLAYAYHTIQ